MKKYSSALLFLIIILFCAPASGQSGQWVWLKGDSTGGSLGNYGAIGVPDAANNAPLNQGMGHWKDLQGNFWTMAYNGLWKYDPLTNEWTFVHPSGGGNGVYGTQGIPSPLNEPPDLSGPMFWTDEAGDFWLFGGDHATFALNALWRYHVATDEWTWMKGTPGTLPTGPAVPADVYGALHVEDAANTPGGRSAIGCLADWTINGDLWLFGGYFPYPGIKNDLWRYRTATNNWIWEGGEQGYNSPGIYGIRGIASGANVPSARVGMTGWHNSNHLYLFSGGNFLDSKNDLWAFEIPLGLWTWTGGDSTAGTGGSDNAFCLPDTNVLIGSRSGFSITAAGVTCTRAYWGFGGSRPGVPVADKLFNDLWLINAGNQTWTKIKGYSSGNPVPYHYGVKGVPDPDNLPRGRYRPCLWTDQSGCLYLFGGGVPYYGGNPAIPLTQGINDLWKFIPDTSCYRAGLSMAVKLTPPRSTQICAGDSTTMPIPSGTSVTVSPAVNVAIREAAGFITFYGGSNATYTVVARPDNACGGYDSATFTISLPPPIHAAFTINPGTAYRDHPVFNFISQTANAVSYAWYEEGRLLATTEDMVYRFDTEGQHCVTLVARDKCGEQDSVTHCCEVIGKAVIFIPNAFSPNGDGRNDVFRVYGGNFRLIALDVYNRYGERVFSTASQVKGWDGYYKGKPCDVGTYYYNIRYFEPDTGKEHHLKGDISLLP